MGVEKRVKILEDWVKQLTADMNEQRKAMTKFIEIVVVHQKILGLAQKSMERMKKDENGK
jgi:hypothetical protein